MTNHDRTIDLLRLDIIHYARLYRDTFAAACLQLARMQVLERQLQETRDELRRYTSERAA
jgi:hypothetical protein